MPSPPTLGQSRKHYQHPLRLTSCPWIVYGVVSKVGIKGSRCAVPGGALGLSGRAAVAPSCAAPGRAGGKLKTFARCLGVGWLLICGLSWRRASCSVQQKAGFRRRRLLPSPGPDVRGGTGRLCIARVQMGISLSSPGRMSLRAARISSVLSWTLGHLLERRTMMAICLCLRFCW